MATMRSTGTSILVYRGTRPAHAEQKDPQKAERALMASGVRPAVAHEVAHGYLSSEAAVRLGRSTGLLR